MHEPRENPNQILWSWRVSR